MSRHLKASQDYDAPSTRKQLCQGARPGDCYIRLVPHSPSFWERLALESQLFIQALASVVSSSKNVLLAFLRRVAQHPHRDQPEANDHSLELMPLPVTVRSQIPGSGHWQWLTRENGSMSKEMQKIRSHSKHRPE